MSEEEVGNGVNGIGVSGRKGSPKSSSLGVALSAGSILSFN